jgi:Dolichyl-phosphate-mannose-protein mannosyltransferase
LRIDIGRPSIGLLDRWIEALLDEERGDRAFALSLIVYAVAWTAYRVVSTMPRDIHVDMAEIYGWSRVLAFGYEKHPPLSAAVVRTWFTVLPVSDLTFTLLATVNIALALYVIWKICRLYMPRDRSALGVALLTLVPFFNFHSLKYNANSVMLPLWAATTYFFLLAYRSLRWQPALLAGLMAGASILGKYWSIFLAAGLGLAAILDRRRDRFFHSPVPWIMTAAGLAVIAPHLAWLRESGYTSLEYAHGRAIATADLSWLKDPAYLVESFGYVAVPVVLAILLIRPQRDAWKDMLWPDDDQRRLAINALALPLLLPALASAAFGLALSPLWSLPNWSLLPVVLLSSPKVEVTRDALRAGLAVASALTLGAFALSPVIAAVLHATAEPRAEQYAATVAAQALEHWHKVTNRPLVFIAGDVAVGPSVAYYLGKRTRYIGIRPLRTRNLFAFLGGVFVCPTDDARCVETGQRIADAHPGARRVEITAMRPLFGIPGPTLRYMLTIAPPPDKPTADKSGAPLQ